MSCCGPAATIRASAIKDSAPACHSQFPRRPAPGVLHTRLRRRSGQSQDGTRTTHGVGSRRPVALQSAVRRRRRLGDRAARGRPRRRPAGKTQGLAPRIRHPCHQHRCGWGRRCFAKCSEDKSHNKFVPFADYLKGEVAATIRTALELETKLVRGFSFDPPLGADPQPYIGQAVEQIGAIVDACAVEGLVDGLEIEPNLVGSTGELMATLAKQVNHERLVLIYDGGNIACQNKDRAQCFREYEAMRPHLGWMHVKDYRIDPELEWTGVVDEERLRNFVPADCGDSGYPDVLRDLKLYLPALERRMQALGAPGFFLETEPHLKGGGQFGGFSGPDGMGVAVRAPCGILG